jgi:GntR family transcriptional repressor for pyruvate dehydrogenase complex
VSRTSIREAVKKMSARGIVDVKRGSGVYVSEMSIKNTSEILNLFFELSTDEDIILQTINTRLILEPALASHAAIYRNQGHLELLKGNMIQMRKCPLEDNQIEADLDNDFHRILLSIVNNKVLELLLSPIFILAPKFKTAVYVKPITSKLLKKKILCSIIMKIYFKPLFSRIAIKRLKRCETTSLKLKLTTLNHYKKYELRNFWRNHVKINS